MVLPPDEPRRPVDWNPIRLNHRLRRERANPYRGVDGSRPPHRVVDRLRSHLSESIIEVNRDNAVSRRIFHNMHIRNRSSNFEHNSMVYRSNQEQPTHTHNLRRTRNKPRRLGVTNAEYQRSRSDAQDEVTRLREELRLMIESYAEPERSENAENCTQLLQQGSCLITESQLQETQPGTSGASEYLNEEPKVGTSSSSWSGGSSDGISMSRRHGYWRPDLDMNSSSSEDDISVNDTNKVTRSYQERDTVQDVKSHKRAQAEMRRMEARITRTRNLSESSSDSDSDLGINQSYQVENITMDDSRTKTSRNSRRRHSNRNIVQEVKADMRAQVETKRKEARFKRKRNFSDIDSDEESPTKSPLQRISKNLSSTKARINLRRCHLEKDIPQLVRENMRRQAEMRRKDARFTKIKNLFSNSCKSDSGIESEIDFETDIHESGGNPEAETRLTEKNIKDDHHNFQVNIEADHCEAADIIETEPIETEENNELADFKTDNNIEAHHSKTESNTESGKHKSDENIEVDHHNAVNYVEVNHHIAQKNIEDGHHKAERNIEDGHRKTEENIDGQHTDENIEDFYLKTKENIEAHHHKTEKNNEDDDQRNRE